MKYILLFCVLFTAQLHAQTRQYNIPITCSDSFPEFSGLAKNNTTLFLLPQYGRDSYFGGADSFYLYTLPLKQVNTYLKKHKRKKKSITTILPLRTVRLNYVQEARSIINRLDGCACWQGFEAVVLVGNRFYFTVETEDESSNNCYLLRGTLHGDRVVLDTNQIVALPRRVKCYNAGYESLAFLPDSAKLLAVFEDNADNTFNQSYLIDTGFTSPAMPYQTPPAFFRLTDITAAGKRLYAVNYFFNDGWKEYDCYVKGKEGSIAAAILPAADSLPVKTSTFARVLTWDRRATPGQWTPVLPQVLSYRNNWEGIVRFKKGFLLVSDANKNPKYQDTRLMYFQ